MLFGLLNEKKSIPMPSNGLLLETQKPESGRFYLIVGGNEMRRMVAVKPQKTLRQADYPAQ